MPHGSLLFMVVLFLPVVAGVCRHCHGDIQHCGGGDSDDGCISFTGTATNAAVLLSTTATSLNVVKLLPSYLLRIFTRRVLDGLVAVARRPQPTDPYDTSGKSAGEIIHAVGNRLPLKLMKQSYTWVESPPPSPLKQALETPPSLQSRSSKPCEVVKGHQEEPTAYRPQRLRHLSLEHLRALPGVHRHYFFLWHLPRLFLLHERFFLLFQRSSSNRSSADSRRFRLLCRGA